MPLNKDALTRYLLIDKRLNNNMQAPPSLKELTEYVSDKLGKQVSESCVQKDILAMRKDPNLGYEAPIQYDPGSKGYKYEYEYSINQLPIAENDLQGISMALSLLSRYQDIPDIANMNNLLLSLAQKVNIQKEALTDISGIDYQKNKYLGIEFIPRILEAINEKKVIYVDYQRFTSDEVKSHKVHPYFLKEFENRIYLIGLDVRIDKDPLVLTFALDRCVDVAVTYDHFTEDIPDRDLYFRDLYGVSRASQGAEKIVLEVNDLQYKYLETNPLHASQKLIQKNGTNTVEINAIVNYELQSKILGMKDNVKVLQPKSLQKDMIDMAQKILKIYEQ